MSSKPVFVPAHKRKRFHGAFTGGFSAGYFNTVGSKEGWKPRQNAREGQTSHDFMDDQDHNEWGGPVSVKQDFVPEAQTMKNPAVSLSSTDWIEPPKNVGTRLMRVLGWREGSTAYVPSDGNLRGQTDEEKTLESAVLSQKRLRKVRLQQSRVAIPPPKLDHGGLGYDVYRDAPEFQAYREKRKREAQQRTRSATAGSKSSNAYILSSLRDGKSRSTGQADDMAIGTDDPYSSYETVQDFVGSKTAGGFAIREDDDDVYDENPLPKTSSSLHIDKNQYDTVLFEHDSDEDEPDKKQQNFNGILSSWATGRSSEATPQGVTSDGRPPLSGFRLGGASSQTEIQRYPGPELPANFVLKKHQFQDDEHPSHFQQVARQEKLEHHRQQASNRLKIPMAHGTFSGLQAAIKNRFTSATSTTSTEPTRGPIGLYRPPPVAAKLAGNPVMPEKVVAKDIKIECTSMIFYPDVLVCKRLGVTPPTNVMNRKPEQKRTAEASFFEDHIMKHAAGAKPKASESSRAESLLKDEEVPEPNKTDHRPAMNVYKSIYEPDSDSEPDDKDQMTTVVDPSKACETRKEENAIVVASSKQIVHTKDEKVKVQDHSKEGRGQQKKHRKRHRDDKKQRKKRSLSSLSSGTDLDASSSDTDDWNANRKGKRHHRKRIPSHSSSETDLNAPSCDEENKNKHRKDKKRRHKKKEKRRKKHKSSRRHEDSLRRRSWNGSQPTTCQDG